MAKTKKSSKKTKPKKSPAPKTATGPAIRAVPFRLEVMRDAAEVIDAAGDKVNLKVPTLFAVELHGAPAERYVYLSQLTKGTRLLVLYTVADGQVHPVTRLPAPGAWTRALVEGTIHVHASNAQLTRKQLTTFIGGHEPPTTPARPPYI